jgi:hypothetical protein
VIGQHKPAQKPVPEIGRFKTQNLQSRDASSSL